jgi:hypothetical protein
LERGAKIELESKDEHQASPDEQISARRVPAARLRSIIGPFPGITSEFRCPTSLAIPARPSGEFVAHSLEEGYAKGPRRSRMFISGLVIPRPRGWDCGGYGGAARRDVASIIQLQRSGEMNKATWAIAQRRASCEGPENTMAAFRRAIELGAGYIEADIQLTSDGQFVCI